MYCCQLRHKPLYGVKGEYCDGPMRFQAQLNEYFGHLLNTFPVLLVGDSSPLFGIHEHQRSVICVVVDGALHHRRNSYRLD